MPNVVKSEFLFCAGCGKAVEDVGLRSCPVCDKLLAEDYQPLDLIRSGYRMHRRNLVPDGISKQNLFEQNKNQISHTAWACVVYSLVPYLGMLFIPFAFVTGGVGYYISVRRPDRGGARLAIICIVLSIITCGVQLLLWWLLYFIPRLSMPIY